MSIAHARSMSRMALSTQRTVCGGQWAAENAPTSFTDTWEDNEPPFGYTGATSWTPSTCGYIPVDSFTNTLVTYYYGPGPTWPYVRASKMEWTAPGGYLEDHYAYVGWAFSPGNIFSQISANNDSSSLRVHSQTGFSSVPTVMWYGTGASEASPAPTTAWVLNRGLWEITVSLTPATGDFTRSNISLQLFPHRSDRFEQRRFKRAYAFSENNIYLDADILSTGSRTDTVDLRSASMWIPVVNFDVKRPPGFTWTAGNTMFTLSVTGSKIAS